MLTPAQIAQAKQTASLGGVSTPSSGMTPEQASAWIGGTSTNASAATPVQPNPVVQGVENFVGDTVSNAKNAITNAGTSIVNDAQTEGAKASAATNPLEKVGDTALGISHVAGDLTGGVGGVVTAPITTSIKNISDLISNSPVVQKIATELPDFTQKLQAITQAHPELTHTLSDLFNVGSSVIAPEAADTKVPILSDPVDKAFVATAKASKGALDATTDSISALGNSALDTAKNVAGAAKDAVTPDPDTSFENNLNKAFPPNKKEIQLGDQRTAAAKTAFQDIIANKDTNGITDENGDAKDPKNYTFQDTMNAQDARMPQIYKDYTSKLEGIDKSKFDSSITGTVVDTMNDLDSKIDKENSVPDRQAMIGLKKELGGLRDTSPQGMQDYLQKLGQRTRTAPGAPLTQEQIQTANLAGKIKEGLDKAVTDTGDTGYAAGRKLYAAHKTMQDAFVRGALKELKATPGLVDKLTTVGMTGEGIQFLLTHNPASLVAVAGMKGANKFIDYIRSPGRALGKLYKISDSQASKPSLLSPEATTKIATNSSNIIPDSVQPAEKLASPDGKPSILEQKPDVGVGMSMGDITKKLNGQDKELLQKYIDNVRLPAEAEDHSILSKAEESDLFKMNELLGIKPETSAQDVANKYEKILSNNSAPSLSNVKQQVSTSGHDYDGMIKAGSIPKNAIFKAGEVLQSNIADHVASDIAAKLDQFKKGLGAKYLKTVNMSLPTVNILQQHAYKLLENI
jgi:hypothetical protein